MILQLFLTPPISPPPRPPLSPHRPRAPALLPPFPPLLLPAPPLSRFPPPQQVMGQPVLRAEQRGAGFLQGRQEHHHVLQQRAAAQPLPLPLRHHQRLQEEEERLHAQVISSFHTHIYSISILTCTKSEALRFLSLSSMRAWVHWSSDFGHKTLKHRLSANAC